MSCPPITEASARAMADSVWTTLHAAGTWTQTLVGDSLEAWTTQAAAQEEARFRETLLEVGAWSLALGLLVGLIMATLLTRARE